MATQDSGVLAEVAASTGKSPRDVLATLLQEAKAGEVAAINDLADYFESPDATRFVETLQAFQGRMLPAGYQDQILGTLVQMIKSAGAAAVSARNAATKTASRREKINADPPIEADALPEPELPLVIPPDPPVEADPPVPADPSIDPSL